MGSMRCLLVDHLLVIHEVKLSSFTKENQVPALPWARECQSWEWERELGSFYQNNPSALICRVHCSLQEYFVIIPWGLVSDQWEKGAKVHPNSKEAGTLWTAEGGGRRGGGDLLNLFPPLVNAVEDLAPCKERNRVPEIGGNPGCLQGREKR